MSRYRTVWGVLLILVISSILTISGCATEASADKLKVVTSTGVIYQIVERVGGERVDVTNIIPPAQCPGHFDVKPGDVQKLADARLFIMHNWQQEKFTQDLIASANNKDLLRAIVEVTGNWMAPPVQREGTDKITEALAEADPENRAAYQEAASEYKARITVKETEIKDRLAKADISGISVLCNEQQVGFLKWMGLDIAGTYNETDGLTPQLVKELVDKGKAANAVLVIDNLQNGADAGKGLTGDLGIKRVTISNFPGGLENTETWEKAIDRNVDLILEALGR